jgi:class 3 adenylate cyclase
LGASPSVAYALNRAALETDLQELWPAVHVPTLFLYRSPQEAVTLDVASRVPGAIAMRVPGIDLDIDVNPEEIVEEIERFVRGEDAPQVPESILTTIMFTDIVGSTEHAAGLGDRAWRDLVSRHHALVRRELSRYRGHERDTAGDGFFATFDGPARAIGAARAISAGVRTLGLEVRIGIHVGECEVHEDKLAGLAVVIGARIASKAVGGEVLVSQTVRDLVAGSGIKLLDRGAHRLKGVPGTWRLFEVAADEV